ncbi:hypothetical protein INR49_020845 [Caranx melampygus]|nr:hypothetical protein INR49_020845 [Caranx melampygus]
MEATSLQLPNRPGGARVTPADPWQASPQQKGPKGVKAARQEIKTEPGKCATTAATAAAAAAIRREKISMQVVRFDFLVFNTPE